MLILNDKHIALHSCEEVKKICLPLFNKTKISYFTFLRYYNDHSRIYLTSNPAWVEFFFKNSLYLYPYGNRLFKECQDSFFSWEDDVNNPVAKEGINFNIDKRFTIVKKFEDYREFYGFGAVTGVDITTNYYLQNIKFFEKFIIFFKIRSVQLIKLYSKEKIYIPPQDIILPKAQNSEDIFDSNFINEFNLNKLIINDISLTRREVDCLKLFLKGFTTKKIASILKKSPRTVETQIDSIKTKLNCFNKNELITKTIGCISIINDF